MEEIKWKAEKGISRYREIKWKAKKEISRYRDQLRDLSTNAEKITSCPVCFHEQFARLFPQTRLISRKNYFANFRLNREYLQKCQKCGLIMSENIYPSEFYDFYLNELHEFIPPYSLLEGIPPVLFEVFKDKNIFRENIVEKAGVEYGIKAKTLLEVSSHYGVGTAEFANRFEVYGVESLKAAARFSERFYPELTNRISAELFENSETFLMKNGPFDIVMFSFVFRHMPQPRKVLDLVQKITSENALVLVDEGVFLDFISDVTYEQAQLTFSHGKMYYYTVDSLVYLFQQYGFDVKDVSFAVSERFGYEYSCVVFQKGRVDPAEDDRIGRSLSKSNEVIKYYRSLPRHKRDEVVIEVNFGSRLRKFFGG